MPVKFGGRAPICDREIVFTPAMALIAMGTELWIVGLCHNQHACGLRY
jgi:hypothetical protein